MPVQHVECHCLAFLEPQWNWCGSGSVTEYAAGLHDQLESFKAVAKNMSPVVFDKYKTDTQHKKNRKRQADKPSEPE